MTVQFIRLDLDVKVTKAMQYYHPPPPKKKKIRWQPTNPAAELHSARPLTDPDFQIKLPTCPLFSCRRRGKENTAASYLFTFLCLPLNTTAKAPCPTRSFLLYSKSPTVSIVMGWWSSWCWAQEPWMLLSSPEKNPGANDPLSPGGAACCTADLFHDKSLLWCALLHK